MIPGDPIRPQMRDLPGGAFLMGDAAGRGDERPVHEVFVSPFALGVFPVSVAEYRVFLQQTDHPQPVEWGQPRFDRPDLPACGVSWDDAVAYADWLAAQAGVNYHLPSEAQREYAARGGLAQLAYPWGDEPPPLVGVYERGLGGPITGGPMALGTPPPGMADGANGFGLYHMADNVHEWCADFYDPRFYAASPRDNPRGPLTPTDRRAARGGSWRHEIKFSRCAARSSLAPQKRFADFGFRLAASHGFEYVR